MAKHPEFRRPEGVHVKQPETDGLFGEESVEPAKPAKPVEGPQIEWEDIPNFVYGKPTYPHNGEPVWLTPDGVTEYIAVWRTSREYRDGRFQPVGFWAVRNGGGLKIAFEPMGYRRYEEPTFFPMKRA